jgi:zinc protease
MKTNKFQLKNGMKVIMVESHKSPVVSIQMWVRTGSADEKKGEEGISHFIEHLVFKGTRKFKVGEIASMIEGSGGELNAYTSFDQTVFYVTISKEFVDTGLEAISEMMGFPLFDETEINNEREVVIEEIKRGQDSLGRRASQLLFSTAFEKHPYGVPVIGFEKNIRELPVKKIKRYYSERYCPQNMFLVVAGDFKQKEMKTKVVSKFSEFKKYKIRKISRKKESIQKKAKIKVEKSNFEQSICYFAWRVPSLKHKDIPALDVLSMVLGAGDSSRLVQKLRIENPIVNSVGSSVFSPQDEGLFVVSIGYHKENLESALKGIFETIEKLFIVPPSSEEITRAVISLEADKFYSEETVDGIARSVGSQEFAAKDLKFQEKYLKAIQKVDAKAILKTAKKYLLPEKLIATAITNDNPKIVQNSLEEMISEYKIKFKSIKLESIKPKTVKKIKNKKISSLLGSNTKEIEKINLKNGITVLFRESNETHMVSARAAFLGGLRNESDSDGGLTELLTRTWMTGTANRNEMQIYNEIESVAASISPIAGRNTIGLGLDSLSTFEDKGREIFLDILTQPLFGEESIEREKEVQTREIKQKYDNPSNVAGREFVANIFKGHPYSRDLLGTESSLKSISKAKVLRHWNLISNRKNLTVMVSGKINKAKWIKDLEAVGSALGSSERFEKKFTIPDLSSSNHLFIESKKEQSHVMYGFPGLTITDPQKYALQIMQSILAGQGGRLFIELRDKNSLAYSVAPIHMEGLECGYFGAYIGCSPEKVKKAISMMTEQFNRLADEPVNAEELKRAQRYLVGRHDIDLQRNSAVASAVLYEDIYGIDYNETFNIAEKYFAVTADQIRSLAQKIFKHQSLQVVVGPENPFKG